MLRWHLPAHPLLPVGRRSWLAGHDCSACSTGNAALAAADTAPLPAPAAGADSRPPCISLALLPCPLPPPCSNAHSFPQDRATGYKLYALPEPNSSVLWTQFVHGTFYQVSLR